MNTLTKLLVLALFFFSGMALAAKKPVKRVWLEAERQWSQKLENGEVSEDGIYFFIPGKDYNDDFGFFLAKDDLQVIWKAKTTIFFEE